MTAAIAAEDIRLAFGGLRAVDGVSFAAARGEVLAIIGPNGAGKTTLFNIVSGLYRPGAGSVRLGGIDITFAAVHERARLGLSRTFQNLQVFSRLTAVENVMVGRFRHERTRLLAHLAAWPSVARDNRQSRARALDLLGFVGLQRAAEAPAGALPYGALKRLEIARALATEPTVLLLDEPAAGCNPIETAELDALIQAVARSGVAVVLVEHDMKLVMKISDRILVLNHGRPLALGPAAVVRSDPAVIAAYLGRRREAATEAQG